MILKIREPSGVVSYYSKEKFDYCPNMSKNPVDPLPTCILVDNSLAKISNGNNGQWN